MPIGKYSKKSFRPAEKRNILKSIWSDEKGRSPRMDRLERQKRSRLFRFLAITAVFFAFLAGFTWLGIYFTGGSGQNEGVQIKIDVPQEIENLKEIDWQITYKNTEKQPLGTASLFLRFPADLQISSTEPKADNENNNQWTLGALSPGQEGKIDIKGKILSNAGNQINLQAILTYKPANFNSEFQVVKDAAIMVKETPINFSFNEQGEIMPGEQVNLEFTLRHDGTESLSNVVLEMDYPSAFVPDHSEPALDNNQRLVLKNLDPGQEQKIAVRGAFTSEAEGSYEIKANLVSEQGGKTYLLKSAGQTLQVNKSNLTLRLFINEQAENQQARFGDTLQIRVDFANQSANELEKVVLKVLADSPLLDWTSLKGVNLGKVTDNVLVWDSSSVPALAKVKSNDHLSLSFNVNLKSPDEKNTGNSAINFSAAALINKVNKQDAQTEIKTSQFSVKVGSDLKLQSRAIYYDANQTALGSGPLPPEVGKETKYRIIWQLNNSYHELQSIKTTATLPDNLRFGGEKTTSAGKLSFDPTSRVITWTIERLSPENKNTETQFDVSVIPRPEDRGKIILLLSEAQAMAQDVVVQTQIAARAPSLSSNLTDDPLATGKGTVK